ncbi:hypothetical protein IFM89_024159 [Coptis chinensis]|uniref:F-box domain-containing protein n=1 Tax=Coptis chinensis TaxID=261450 RepID=A0A835M3Z2_9MAGN|nr:hypothetical protein IFM89_024159 [Coptis chinensis]
MVGFSCQSCVQFLWETVYQLFYPSSSTDRQLPNEIIVDIFSRLPAECIVRCAHACKPLRALARSPAFVDKHLIPTPVIALAPVMGNKGNLLQKMYLLLVLEKPVEVQYTELLQCHRSEGSCDFSNEIKQGRSAWGMVIVDRRPRAKSRRFKLWIANPTLKANGQRISSWQNGGFVHKVSDNCNICDFCLWLDVLANLRCGNGDTQGDRTGIV